MTGTHTERSRSLEEIGSKKEGRCITLQSLYGLAFCTRPRSAPAAHETPVQGAEHCELTLGRKIGGPAQLAPHFLTNPIRGRVWVRQLTHGLYSNHTGQGWSQCAIAA